MRGKIALIVFAVIIVFVGGFFLFQQNADKSVEDNEAQIPENKEEILPATHNIDISNFKFQSNELTINIGDTVTWTNQDSTGHTVTLDSGNELDSQLLLKKEIFSHTFTEKGTYEYHCTPHPYMKGKIIVE